MGASNAVIPSLVNLYQPQPIQPAGNRIGVFSAANYAEDLTLGRGPAWNVVGRVFQIRKWRSAASNNQGLWRFGNAALTGWGLLDGNSRDQRLFLRPAAGSTVLNNPMYLGLYSCAFRILDVLGNSRCSINGSPSFAVALPGAFVAEGATAIHSIGKWQSEAAFPAVGTSILQAIVIDGYSGVGTTTDADIEYLSGDRNQGDRWNPRPEVAAHARLVMLFDANAWGGGAGSNYAPAGSGGYVFKMQGTGGAKSPLRACSRVRIPPRAIFGNALDEYYEAGVRHRSVFAYTAFTSDSADVAGGDAGLTVDCYGKNLGIVGNAYAGGNVNATDLVGNNIGAEPDVFDVQLSIDVPGIVAGAAKPFVVTETINSLVIATGEVKPNTSPQALRTPTANPITFGDSYAAVTNCCVYTSHSLMEQVGGLTDVSAIKGPSYKSVVALQRVALGARRLGCNIYGGDTFFNRISTAQKRTDFVRLQKAQCVGTASNWIREMRLTNDYGTNTYVLLTTLEADLVAYWTALFAAGIPGLKYQALGDTDRTGGGTPNGSGWTLANFRTALSNAVTTFASADVSYHSMAAVVTSPGNMPDGLHWNEAGHLQASNDLTANLPP